MSLAYKMNDVDLPPQHGFPLRAIVPGLVRNGIDQVLQCIIVTDRPSPVTIRPWITHTGESEDIDELAPLSEMQIKAEIAKPTQGEIVPANSTFRACGAAWTSDGEITKSRAEHRRRREIGMKSA